MTDGELEEQLNKLRLEPDLWDIFTRKEEYNSSFRDKYGRFPYYLSKERGIFEPKVSKYLVENGFKIEYPGGKEFAVCLTHDIDFLYHSRIGITDVRRSLGSNPFNLHGQLKEILRRPFYNLHKKWNPWWNFQEIMDLEEEYGARSTFFIMGLEEGDQDFNYPVENISHELGNIIDRGWEVGLHGGNDAYNNLKALKKQKANLEKSLGTKVTGYRNHFLRFNVPETWKLLEDAGFKYDATFGYADSVGFRAGICHPFRPFDLNTQRFMNIYEIPLTIMDVTLFDSYMRADVSIAWGITKSLVDIAKKYNGMINILWHNTSMFDEYREFYSKILNFCDESGAAMITGEMAISI